MRHCVRGWTPRTLGRCLVAWSPERLVLASLASLTICPASFSQTECVSGLFLFNGRCEAVCPARTYPGTNAKERDACMPCHYSCLTCVGEEEDECLSCFDDAQAVTSRTEAEPSQKISHFRNLTSAPDDGFMVAAKPDIVVSPDDIDKPVLSYGKRSPDILVKSRKAVTKKILEPQLQPRQLYVCYPRSLWAHTQDATWYYRMVLLFLANLTFLMLAGAVLLCCWCTRQRKGQMYKYSKVTNGERPLPEDILYVSSSSDEE